MFSLIDQGKALILRNIPLHEIVEICFRSFLEKYTGKSIPTVYNNYNII